MIPVFGYAGEPPRAVRAETSSALPATPPQPAWLPSSGVPGELVVFGPCSRVWLTSRRDDQEVPVAAVADAGSGRVLALAHDGFVNRAADAPDGRTWFTSAVRWAAHTAAPHGPLRVALIGARGATRALNAEEFKIIELNEPGTLASVDVVVAVGRLIAAGWIPSLAEHVERGGGLIVAETAWSWDRAGRSLADHPVNRLCARWGIVWTDETCEPSPPEGFRPPKNATLVHALHAFEALARGNGLPDPGQAIAAVETAMRYLPDDDPILRPRFQSLLEAHPFDPPTASNPVRRTEALRRLAVTHATLRALSRPPAEMRALPGIEAFPGTTLATAEHGRRELVLDVTADGWISTGLYVPAGEPVQLEVPAELVAANLRARIGAHTDRLWHLATWKRYPEVSLERPVTSTVSTVASPFGGLLYLERRGPGPNGPLRLAIQGAVEAPLFRRGHTSLEEWRRRREAPAPWGELAGHRVILTLPSDRLRQLENPAPVLELWDRVLDACAELAARPAERPRPERIVPDVQISAGYMHSGYPIMTHADQYDVLANRDAILRGSWGLFHELGHNHQERDWTFEGTSEVTVNLFTLYVLETVCGLPPLTGHPEIRPEVQDRLRRQYIAGGRRFEQWKRNPFLALGMYMQLREAFGWEPFRRVFAEYRVLPAAARPRTDAERRDQWLLRMSAAVGRNLGPFFDSWGIPVSESARAQIARLPLWMPDHWPPSQPAEDPATH